MTKIDEAQERAEDVILHAKAQFGVLEPFLAAVMGLLKPIAAPHRVQYMGVDAVGNLYYNPDWVAELSPKKGMFVFAHETLHVGLGHMKRGAAIQAGWLRLASVVLSLPQLHQVWDSSANHAVNAILYDRLGFIPDDAEYDPRFHGKSAEEIFLVLVKEAEAEAEKAASGSGAGDLPLPNGRGDPASGPGGGQPTPQPGDGDDGDGGGGRDPDKKQDDSKGSNGAGQGADQPAPPSGAGGWDTHIYDVPAGTDREQAMSRIETQVRSLAAALGAGNQDAQLKRILEKAIGVPEIPWQVLVRRYMTATTRSGSSWSRLNRRLLPHGVLMPSRRRPAMQDLVIAMDVSGSIAATPKSKFYDMAREAMTVPGTQVHFLAFDTKVRDTPPHFGTFQPGQTIIRPEVLPAGGGTSFWAVWDWIKRKGIRPKLVIMLTDADGYLPATCPGPYDVKWVLTPKYGTTDTYIIPKFGEVVAKI